MHLCTLRKFKALHPKIFTSISQPFPHLHLHTGSRLPPSADGQCAFTAKGRFSFVSKHQNLLLLGRAKCDESAPVSQLRPSCQVQLRDRIAEVAGGGINRGILLHKGEVRLVAQMQQQPGAAQTDIRQGSCTASQHLYTSICTN